MSFADVLIVGGGPAGLSAALTLVRQNHHVLVFDHGDYRALPSLRLHGVTGAENKPPAEHLADIRSELRSYKNYHYHKVEVTSLESVDGGFQATDVDGITYKGKKVILANGVDNVYPEIEGFKEVWGKGIFHNLFAQAYQAEPSSVRCGVLAIDLIAMPQFTFHLCHLAYQLAHHVTIYTNGNEELIQQIAPTLENKPWKTDSRKISKFALKSPDSTDVIITFEDGSTAEEAFIGHATASAVRGPFVEQLGLKISRTGGEYEVQGPWQGTGVPGVFAAGDNATMFKAWPNAIGSGAQVAAGVAVMLQEEKWGLPHIYG